jgi:hypothetical protein
MISAQHFSSGVTHLALEARLMDDTIANPA